MVVAKLARAGIEDQVFSLEPGEYRLGSDFSCDFALIHPAIAPEHLKLKVGEDTVSIRPSGGAVVMLFQHASQAVVTLKSEEWIAVHPGDRLIIADVSLEIQGIRPIDPNKVTQGALKAIPGAAAMAILFIAITGLNLTFTYGPDRIAAAHAEPTTTDEPGRSSDNSDAEAEQIRQRLVDLGVIVDNITGDEQAWRVTLRVGDMAARKHILAELAKLAFPLVADIHVDAEIAEAVALIAANLDSGSQVLSVTNGVVTLSPIQDEALREKLVKTLQSDVPGLSDVRFEDSAPFDLGSLLLRVTAVWHGAFPYVVLDDGTIVREGEVLGHAAKLLAIQKTRLLVEVEGQQREVTLDDSAARRIYQ